MSAVRPLPRRLEATDEDLRRGRDAARVIATATLGHDPGPMTTAVSMSHYVYMGAGVVVKLVDVDGHHRLDLETALAPHLPSGLGAPVLSSGRRRLADCEVRYACFARMPGTSPGIGLAGASATRARRWAGQAVRRLDDLHNWAPRGTVELALRQSSIHEGFTGRAALFAHIQGIVEADRDRAVPPTLIDGLAAIAQQAPADARCDVPVHADCDWGNWLADDQDITALLDFERARFGVPADDWVLLAATSGPHIGVILDVIAEQTGTAPEAVRAECELRDAAFIAEDLYHAFQLPDLPHWATPRIRDLQRLVSGRRWWPPVLTRPS